MSEKKDLKRPSFLAGLLLHPASVIVFPIVTAILLAVNTSELTKEDLVSVLSMLLIPGSESAQKDSPSPKNSEEFSLRTVSEESSPPRTSYEATQENLAIDTKEYSIVRHHIPGRSTAIRTIDLTAEVEEYTLSSHAPLPRIILTVDRNISLLYQLDFITDSTCQTDCTLK